MNTPFTLVAMHSVVGEQKANQKSSCKNKCGPGQPPEPHRSWISRLAFPPLRAASRRYWSDSAHEECHFYQYCCRAMVRRIISMQPVWWPAAQPAPKSRKWRRPQCPGNRFAHARVSEFPLAIHPRELPAATGVTAIIVRQALRDSNVFAKPTLRQKVASRNRKTFPACAEAVDGVTSLWKAEENRE